MTSFKLEREAQSVDSNHPEGQDPQNNKYLNQSATSEINTTHTGFKGNVLMQPSAAIFYNGVCCNPHTIQCGRRLTN